MKKKIAEKHVVVKLGLYFVLDFITVQHNN